jgi:hypothetical protein
MFKGEVSKDIKGVVWLGCLALLFLAVAVHEGWFAGSGATGIVTSGSANDLGAGSSDSGGVVNDPEFGNLPNWGGD